VGERGRKAGATNRKRGGSAALAPSTFPRSVAWRVDQDYVATLGPSERAWLAQFNDRFYGADFRGESEATWSTDERREVYRDKNRANRDLMTCALPVDVEVPHEAVELEEAVVDDLAHLDAAEYKTAREAYRADPSPANRVRLHATTKRR
jgi:hypothetical protein